MIRNFNYFGVFISLIGLIVLLYDFFLTDEFRLESSYVASLSFAIIINSVRLLHPKLNRNIGLAILSNSILLGFLGYTIWMLFWTMWGNGYFGRENPLISDLAISLNSIMILFMMIEFVIFIKSRENK